MKKVGRVSKPNSTGDGLNPSEVEPLTLAMLIFAVVDMWDALTFDRTYRNAWTKESA